MDEHLRNQVWERAGRRCEYCLLHQDLDSRPFQIDHIIAIKHHGPTVFENLALSCYDCNTFKGPNIAGIDAETRSVLRLFHPRADDWNEHFRWEQAILVGKTDIGRVTIDVLEINSPERVRHRLLLLQIGALSLGN